MNVGELRRKLEGVEDGVEVYTYDEEYGYLLSSDARLSKLVSTSSCYNCEIEDDPDWKKAFSEELKNNQQTTAFLIVR